MAKFKITRSGTGKAGFWAQISRKTSFGPNESCYLSYDNSVAVGTVVDIPEEYVAKLKWSL